MTKDLQFHAIDLIQTVCSTSRDYAGQIFLRIVAAKQFFELDITYVVRGVRKMPLVSFHQAIKLLMVLPGVKANDGRGKFAQVVHAFIAGDPELKTKIDENAESLHWFNVLARESLQADRAAASNRQTHETSTSAGAANCNGNGLQNVQDFDYPIAFSL
jgi:hypothetical protein